MNSEKMHVTLRVTKALADLQRLRIIMMLEPGELCVCQIVEVLGLAPSTVSKHLSILAAAGLVDCRRDGRWSYYRLPDTAVADPIVKNAVDLLRNALCEDAQIRHDLESLNTVTACSPEDLSRRQRGGDGLPGLSRRSLKNTGEPAVQKKIRQKDMEKNEMKGEMT